MCKHSPLGTSPERLRNHSSCHTLGLSSFWAASTGTTQLPAVLRDRAGPQRVPRRQKAAEKQAKRSPWLAGGLGRNLKFLFACRPSAFLRKRVRRGSVFRWEKLQLPAQGAARGAPGASHPSCFSEMPLRLGPTSHPCCLCTQGKRRMNYFKNWPSYTSETGLFCRDAD